MEGEKQSRRDFLLTLVRGAGVLALGGTSAVLAGRSLEAQETWWQIDPDRCTQCGRCETACVRKPSAVKCIHGYAVCGYCDLCSGYLRSGAALDTGAEGQLCPTSALKRRFVEDPYFEYVVDEDACIACARCVKGCSAFGNGSLFLQVKQNLCLHCSRCSVAQSCPAGALRPVSRDEPYLLKGDSST